MGLDMYLYAKRSFFAPMWSIGDRDSYIEERKVVEAIRAIPGIKWPEPTNNLNSIELKFEVGYWRKANHIHNWFVQEIQDGVDECQESPDFEIDKLKELGDLCKQVLAARDNEAAKAKLPPIIGFFFGSIEVDEWYWDKTQNTADLIDRLVEWVGDDYNWSFQYHASW
jgi:hypothetical protein